MTNQDYLIKRGWVEHSPGIWHNPTAVDLGWLETDDAFKYQLQCDAARLDTALAALELAEPLLTDYRKYLISAGQPGCGEVTEALAAVRAAKEGRDI